MGAENQQRYQQFLLEYNESLPETITQEERQRLLNEALDLVVNRDVATLATRAQADLQHDWDHLLLLMEKHEVGAGSELEQIRKTIGL